MANQFLANYEKIVASSAGNYHNDNHDSWRFGSRDARPMTLKHRLRSFAALVSHTTGFMDGYRCRLVRKRGIDLVKPHLDKLEDLYQRLSDEESRQILLQVLAYRALGQTRVKLPLNNVSYWASIEAIEKKIQGAECIDLRFNGWQAYRVDLTDFGYPIVLFSRPPNVITQFVLQQYRCQTPEATIEASEGDVVLDAGGCYGDTALYFSRKTGSNGRIYSFEFLPDNLEIFRRNLALNPSLSERISIVERPLWSKTGEKIFIEGSGPGARVLPTSRDPNAKQIVTLTIDDFAHDNNLKKVDFIKMDIEGAELQALRGAAETIRHFRPKLAICVYHSLGDFWSIPAYLDTLNVGYRFYLRHFTIHAEETILFAKL